jgi:hypothetical protein
LQKYRPLMISLNLCFLPLAALQKNPVQMNEASQCSLQGCKDQLGMQSEQWGLEIVCQGIVETKDVS